VILSHRRMIVAGEFHLAILKTNYKQMKVLMFGWEFPPHISGGLGTACYGLTKALSGMPDMKITFVVPKLWGDEPLRDMTMIGADQVPVFHSTVKFTDTDEKIEYYELCSGLVPYLGTVEYDELLSKRSSLTKRMVETTKDGRFIFEGNYGQNLFQEIRNYALIAEKIACELEFDVIHVHDWMTFEAGIAAKNISGKPLVIQIHSTEFDRSGIHVHPGICSIEKSGMEVADAVIAVSNLTRNICISNYHVNPEKILTVYNAAEALELIHERKKKEPNEKHIVSFLGRITHQKGPEYFIDAANLVIHRNYKVHFVMAGKGDLRDAMIKRTKELGISEYFDFPGFIHDSEVIKLFLKSDVFVMPSVSEPFGIVALEAMQAMVPVIVSNQSGASEILENVIKVDYWDINEMANAIEVLISDRNFCANLSSKAKLEVDKISWMNSASAVHDVYLELVSNR
jgi:glycosyltransferase involved in cell wall biosynthesis